MTIKRSLAALLLLAACTQPQSPALAQPEAANTIQRWRMPAELREISGLAVSPDERLFAHDDERAIIYEIEPREGRLVKRFALGQPLERGDFEGLAITPAGVFWMTTSQGQLYRFSEADDGATAAFERFDTGLRDVCEIEGLAYLAADDSLILACKRNQARDMRDWIALYQWRPGAAQATLWRRFDAAELASAAGVERFRPSSLDIAGDRMLLLSAHRGALAEYELDGERISVRALGPEHPQAEGVVRLPDGAIVISDEGGDGQAQLSIYPRSGP